MGCAIADRAEPLLVGRDDEIAQLLAAVERCRLGSGWVMVVQGDAGIGKTRMLREAMAVADSAGISVAAGAAHELQARRPFAAIARCLGIHPGASDDRLRSVSAMLSASPGGPWQPADIPLGPLTEFRVGEAILRLVEDRASSAPLILAVDDLQWADPATVALLRDLAHAARQTPLGLLLACRPVPRNPVLTGLLDELARDDAEQLRLGPLSPGDVGTLVEYASGSAPSPRELALAARAGGNPLLLIELIRTLLTAGSAADETGVENEQLLRPHARSTAAVDWLRALPAGTVDILRIAAVLGTSFSVGELSATASVPAAHLVGPLRDSLEAGILCEFGDEMAFRHDLIRETLYADIPGALRTALHVQAAQSLGQTADPIRVAEHFMRAGRTGGQAAVPWLAKAARQAADGAPQVAVDLLSRALELCPPAEKAAASLMADRAVALMWCGQLFEAEAMCREILATGCDSDVEATVRTCLTHALLAGGRAELAVEEVTHALASASLTEPARIKLMAWGSHALMFVGDLDGAVAMASAAQIPARASDDVMSECIATACLAMVNNFRGNFDDAVDLMTSAVRIADRSRGRSAHQFQLNSLLGVFLFDVDRLDDARAAIADGRHVSEELGARWTIVLYLINSLGERFLSGNWDDAIAEYEATCQLATETGTRHGMVYAHSVRSMIALRRGDLLTAEQAASAAETEFAEAGPQWHFLWAVWARALLLEATGDPQQATDALQGAWDACVSIGLKLELPTLGPDLVRLALSTGNRHAAERATTELEQLACSNNAPTTRGQALRCRAHLDLDPKTALKAVEAIRASGRPLDLAKVCEDAGGILIAAGRPADAHGVLCEAADLFGSLGASQESARIEAILRQLGVRRGVKGPRIRPKTGWNSLTPTETRIVELVADGLSNPAIAERLFISRLTVRTHLSHVFAKLEVASRTELAVEYARRLVS